MDGNCQVIVKYPIPVSAMYELVTNGSTTEDICGKKNYILFIEMSKLTKSLEKKGVNKRGQYRFIVQVRFKFLTKNIFYMMYIISGLQTDGAKNGQSRLPEICQKLQGVCYC